MIFTFLQYGRVAKHRIAQIQQWTMNMRTHGNIKQYSPLGGEYCSMCESEYCAWSQCVQKIYDSIIKGSHSPSLFLSSHSCNTLLENRLLFVHTHLTQAAPTTRTHHIYRTKEWTTSTRTYSDTHQIDGILRILFIYYTHIYVRIALSNRYTDTLDCMESYLVSVLDFVASTACAMQSNTLTFSLFFFSSMWFLYECATIILHNFVSPVNTITILALMLMLMLLLHLRCTLYRASSDRYICVCV